MGRNAYDEFNALTQAQRSEVLLNLDPVSDRELKEIFDSGLNEALETVKIGALEYEPADVLRSVDPTAYSCEFSDWLGTNEDFVELCGEFTDDEGRKRILCEYYRVDEVLNQLDRLNVEEE